MIVTSRHISQNHARLIPQLGSQKIRLQAISNKIFSFLNDDWFSKWPRYKRTNYDRYFLRWKIFEYLHFNFLSLFSFDPDASPPGPKPSSGSRLELMLSNAVSALHKISTSVIYMGNVTWLSCHMRFNLTWA